MEKYFLPYELALELQKIGFNDVCLAGFLIADDGQFCIYGLHTNHENPIASNDDWLSTPLYDQAIEWLHKKGANLHDYYLSDENKYGCDVYSFGVSEDKLVYSELATGTGGKYDTKREALNKAIEETIKIFK